MVGFDVNLYTVLAAFCAVFCAVRLYCIVHQLVYPFIVCPILSKSIDPRSLGRWAVVTGATDGIGLAYARCLAQRGVNLLLVSRSSAKLLDVQRGLVLDFPSIEVKTHAIDLSTQNLDDFERLGEVISELEVGLLFNNAGCAAGKRGYFYDIEKNGGGEVIQNILSVNLHALAQITRLALPGMLRRGRGAIVNNSSMSGTTAIPTSTLYASSKAAVLRFDSSLRAELQGRGVIVQSLYPMFVATKMSKKQPSIFTPTADAYANEALNTLGVTSSTTGCLTHQLQYAVIHAFPKALRDRIMTGAMTRMMEQQEKTKE